MGKLQKQCPADFDSRESPGSVSAQRMLQYAQRLEQLKGCKRRDTCAGNCADCERLHCFKVVGAHLAHGAGPPAGTPPSSPGSEPSAIRLPACEPHLQRLQHMPDVARALQPMQAEWQHLQAALDTSPALTPSTLPGIEQHVATCQLSMARAKEEFQRQHLPPPSATDLSALETAMLGTWTRAHAARQAGPQTLVCAKDPTARYDQQPLALRRLAQADVAHAFSTALPCLLVSPLTDHSDCVELWLSVGLAPGSDLVDGPQLRHKLAALLAALTDHQFSAPVPGLTLDLLFAREHLGAAGLAAGDVQHLEALVMASSTRARLHSRLAYVALLLRQSVDHPDVVVPRFTQDCLTLACHESATGAAAVCGPCRALVDQWAQPSSDAAVEDLVATYPTMVRTFLRGVMARTCIQGAGAQPCVCTECLETLRFALLCTKLYPFTAWLLHVPPPPAPLLSRLLRLAPAFGLRLADPDHSVAEVAAVGTVCPVLHCASHPGHAPHVPAWRGYCVECSLFFTGIVGQALARRQRHPYHQPAQLLLDECRGFLTSGEGQPAAAYLRFLEIYSLALGHTSAFLPSQLAATTDASSTFHRAPLALPAPNDMRLPVVAQQGDSVFAANADPPLEQMLTRHATISLELWKYLYELLQTHVSGPSPAPSAIYPSAGHWQQLLHELRPHFLAPVWHGAQLRSLQVVEPVFRVTCATWTPVGATVADGFDPADRTSVLSNALQLRAGLSAAMDMYLAQVAHEPPTHRDQVMAWASTSTHEFFVGVRNDRVDDPERQLALLHALLWSDVPRLAGQLQAEAHVTAVPLTMSQWVADYCPDHLPVPACLLGTVSVPWRDGLMTAGTLMVAWTQTPAPASQPRDEGLVHKHALQTQSQEVFRAAMRHKSSATSLAEGEGQPGRPAAGAAAARLRSDPEGQAAAFGHLIFECCALSYRVQLSNGMASMLHVYEEHLVRNYDRVRLVMPVVRPFFCVEVAPLFETQGRAERHVVLTVPLADLTVDDLVQLTEVMPWLHRRTQELRDVAKLQDFLRNHLSPVDFTGPVETMAEAAQQLTFGKWLRQVRLMERLKLSFETLDPIVPPDYITFWHDLFQVFHKGYGYASSGPLCREFAFTFNTDVRPTAVTRHK